MNNVGTKKYIIDAGNTVILWYPTFIAGTPQLFGMQVSAKF
jgi:hypothetical protein